MTSSNFILRQLASRCSQIAADVSDYDGFVSIDRLVNRFGAKLLVRPLLVEGMLVSTDDEASGAGHQWCLLLDRETYDVKDADIANERLGAPLPARLRNTVAHELAHAMAFRPTEFGVEFPNELMLRNGKRDFVAMVERQTEKLSPLLLLPDDFLARTFTDGIETVSIQALSEIMRSAGVSRYVFINRLNSLSLSDKNRLSSRQCLTGLGIGIGEWKPEQNCSLKGWPFFSHFEGGKVPGFVFQLQRGIAVPANDIFHDESFYLCGGASDTTECVITGGTPKNPDSVKLSIRCAVEIVQRRPDSEFLFLIQAHSC
jgi:hypothetical protein